MLTTNTNHHIFSINKILCLFSMLCILISILLFPCRICFADNQPPIPDILKPWIDWVLHDKTRSIECIPHFNNPDVFQCAWATAIDLDLNSSGGTFTQEWQIYHETYIPLPGGNTGSTSQWPEDVMVNAMPAVIIPQNDTYGNAIPTVKAMPGHHTITGSFVWDKQPEYIQIPPESALVALQINNSLIEFPNMDNAGRLWLRSEIAEKKEENRLKIEAFRLIDDSIPALMTLHATLDVAGLAREIRLGTLYLKKEFVPLSLDSALPSKLESDGTMKIQVKPGRYTFTLTLRYLGSLDTLTFTPSDDGYWPKQEIWSVLRRPDLRIVEISGGAAIDPQRTSLPEEWRSYPAHVMLPEEAMIFKEIKRGEPVPPPDQLILNRTLWLSFDGTGYTIQDKITGKKNSNWRLEMEPLMEPGRVMVDRVEQLITKRNAQDKNQDQAIPKDKALSKKDAAMPKDKAHIDIAGVELRHGILDLTADSTIHSSIYTIPATGWDHAFQKVTGQLNLPPGWKLISASGIDNIHGTWVKKWTLLDLFIVLIFTISTAKLFSRPLAVVAFITLVLLYHESGAPRYVWLFLIAGFALLKHLPSGKFKKLVQAYQFLTFIILLLLSVTYAISALRVGIYPQLERPWISMNDAIQKEAGGSYNAEADSLITEMASPEAEMNQSEAEMDQSKAGMDQAEIEMNKFGTNINQADTEMDSARREMGVQAQAPMESYNTANQYKNLAKGKFMGMAKRSVSSPAYMKSGKDRSIYQTRVMQYDPKSLTQTGPGIPLWQPFHTIGFSWSGPVEPGQQISFNLIGPSVNLVLAFLRVFLIILLTVGLFIGAGYGNGKFKFQRGKLKGGKFKSEGENPNFPNEHSKLPNSSIKTSFVMLTKAVSVMLMLVLILIISPFFDAVSSASEIPSPQILAELQRRLLEKDKCFPACADIRKMGISIENEKLLITLHIDAAVATAIPLPGHARYWLPKEVTINGINAQALFRSGETLWVMVPVGNNNLVIIGQIGNQNTFQLPLPLKPHAGTVDAKGWEVQGFKPDGTFDDQLQFKRIAGESALSQEILETGLLPPFALVQRTLLLGLDWKVETTVERMSPQGSAFVINLPLLVGESVITEGVRVINGMAQITLNANQHSVAFESFLESSDTVRLYHALSSNQNKNILDNQNQNNSNSQKSSTPQKSGSSGEHSQNREWTEVWKLDASPVFHVETHGIPVIMHQNNNRWYPTWHPLPGEELILKISRPEGIKGQTLTIEKSNLELHPGQRSTRAILTLYIKSSQGAQHTIEIPEGSELQEVKINGKSQLIRQEGRKVILPVTPGSQNIQLVWRYGEGIISLYQTPQINLGAPSVNAAVALHISSDRWPLFAGGEQLAGPAVLFWSVLIVVIIVSAGLAMTNLTPLKFHQWFLLGIGMSVSNPAACLIVASWLVVLDMRKKWGEKIKVKVLSKEDESGKSQESREDKVAEKLDESEKDEELSTVKDEGLSAVRDKGLSAVKFNLIQIGIVSLTFIALLCLLFSISKGLIGHPSMNITGNGSTGNLLKWYHDISAATLPKAWLFSIPMLAYRIAMLAWALWLSFWLLTIFKWGWSQFTTPVIWADSTTSANAASEKNMSGKKKKNWMGIRNIFKSEVDTNK
ncbi:MAG: hypothetical protein HQK67_02150 [Desulfamplus sp.]|nr:hypothetical protein [Desulfamplus sp.]